MSKDRVNNNYTNNVYSGDATGAAATSSVLAKVQGMNRRVLALILALVFVLTVVPVTVFLAFRGKADSFYDLNPVQMYTRINGVMSETPATEIAAGEISENIQKVNVNLPEGAVFVKAVLLEEDGTTETEIAAVGNIDDKDFYSLFSEDGTVQAGDIGTATKNGQKLVLVYANRYNLSIQKNGEGTYRTSAGTNNYVYAGEDFRVYKIEPEIDYRATSIQYSTEYTNGSIAVSNGEATIPASEIVGNLHVVVNFVKNTSYNIIDASNAARMGNGGITEGQGNPVLNKSEFRQRWNPNPVPVTEDGTNSKTFLMYSNSNSGGSTYILNMFRINGQEVEISAVNSEPVSKDLPDGTHVEISLADDINGQGMYWLDNKPNERYEINHDRDGNFRVSNNTYTFNGTWRKTRTIYRVTVSNVHKDLNIEYNFKLKNQREIIIKNRTGIEQTASAREEVEVESFEYYFNTQDTHIYPAYYNQMRILGFGIPSANLILYKAMPGFNPYVYDEAKMFYVDDDGNAVLDSNAILTDNIGTPEEAIYTAAAGEVSSITYQDYTKFNVRYRQWGGRGKTPSIYNETNERDGLWGEYFVLSTLRRRDDNDSWYAIALKQNTSNNQQLYLALKPYNYRIQLDLDGGALGASDDEDYKPEDANGYREQINSKVIHINDESPYTYLPSEEPTKEGYYFKGWQQVDEDSHFVGDPVSSGTRVTVDDTSVGNTIGDVRDMEHYYRYVAVWEAKEVSDKTAVRTNIFVEDRLNGTVEANGKKYTRKYTNTSTEYVGKAVVLNNHNEVLEGKEDYYTMNLASNTIATLVQQTESNPEPNVFNLYYDDKLYDLAITNTVLGYPKTKNFNISVTITPDSESPYVDISESDANSIFISSDESSVQGTLVKNEDGTFTYAVSLSNNESTVLTLPYNWTYSIEEAQNPDDYKTNIDPAAEGVVTKNCNVEIINMQNNAGVKTEKTIDLQPDGTYTITLKSWATGQTYSKPVKDLTPLDIALIIDQSGSMGTEDMDSEITEDMYAPVNKEWTISEATEGKTYYYKVGNSFYPVVAQEGTLYQKTEASSVKVNALYGSGHDSTVLDSIGSRVHFNVPTNYYVMYQGVPRKVYILNVGAIGYYVAYPYFYTDQAYEQTSGSNGNGSEWTEDIWWLDANWDTDDLVKLGLTEKSYHNSHGGTAGTYALNNDGPYSTWHTIGFTGSKRWIDITYNQKIHYIEKDGTISNIPNRTSLKNSERFYAWLFDGVFFSDEQLTIPGNVLYQVSDTQGYNRLAYVDDNGDEHPFGNAIYQEGETTYSGNLYELNGTSRVSALQSSVAEFASSIAQSAKESGADHRMAIIGFAGNKVPNLSEGTTANNTTKYDYTNTGLFVNNTFKNYQTITGYSSSPVTTAYINRHYYTKNDGTGNPVRYFGSGWYELTDNGWVAYSGNKYEASYSNGDLTTQNYQDALVTVNDINDSAAYDTSAQEYTSTKRNGVNDKLDKAISQFGNYGGTYTSYGITMANKLFEANPVGDDETRQRIVVVFTDGEPGANGYEAGIANEAIADSSILKNDHQAKVYTVGLYKTDPSTEVESFMNRLSSEYSAQLEEVTGGSQNKGNLDPDATYYYIGSDGKTYSLTAKKNGESTLGWWITDASNGVVYTSVTPMSSSGAGSQQFYDANGNSVQANWDTSGNTVYYTTNSASTRKPIRYEYRWYDSNNGIKDPIGTDNTATTNTVQFYSLGTAVPKPSDDTDTYYLTADDASSLSEKFSKIIESIAQATVQTELDEDTSLMKDVITSNFDVSHASVSAKAVQCDYINDEPQETQVETSVSGAEIDRETRTVTVTGWDYSANYIGTRPDDSKGSKLVVTIEGLVPVKEGWNLESNTNESGVYERQFDEDDHEIDPQMLQAFDIPKVNRPGYNLVTDGDDTEATYTVKLKLVNKDGQVLTAGQYELLNGETFTQLGTPDVDGFAVWTTSHSNNDPDDIRTDTVVLEDVFKNLPEGYKVFAKVTKTDDRPSLFAYSLKLNGETSTDEDENTVPDWNVPFEIKNGDEIEIDSTRKTVEVTINEITKPKDGDPDYSEKDKEFDVVLTLKDLNNDGVNNTYNGVTFTDGIARLKMRHGQTRKINIPVGYTLHIDVDVETQEPYYDSYTKDSVAIEGDEFGPVAIDANTVIDVINTIDAPDIASGVLDTNNPFGIILAVLAAICGVAAAGTVFYTKRKKKEDE